MSTQLVSYNFSTVENPLSDGGNFTTLSDATFTGTLKVIAGNICEPVSVSAVAGSIYSGISWPNDQYSEITITHFGAGTQQFFTLVRCEAFNSATYYLLRVRTDNQTYTVIRALSGVLTNIVANQPTTITQNDVWRLSVTGTLLTITRNGSVITSMTDSFISSGSVGFGLLASTAITNAQTSLWAGGSNAVTPSGPWSPVDSRTNKPNNATFRTVNQAQIDDVQTSSNPAVPGQDCRISKPVVCGIYPQNSRNAPPF